MKVLALAGGVGGAKLAAGLESALSPGDHLAVVVNTADDFDLWGLRICPDLDTVMYTLAGVANPETGWGLVDESFDVLDMLARYGEDTWFKIGDRDLATHVLRTARLRAGEPLTGITAYLEGGGSLEHAQQIAAHESPRTTKLYDRTSDVADFGVYNGSTLAVYVNGVLSNEIPTAVTSIPLSDNSLRIGADSTGGSLFNGIIDEPRIFDRALSADEIATIFYQGTNCQ